MAGKVRKVVFRAVPVLVVVAVLWRLIQIAPYPLGGGQYLVSPDGTLQADAFALTEVDFWGGERDYYEFTIRPAGKYSSDSVLKCVRMDRLPGQPFFCMRGEQKIISWAQDSKSVTFAFQGIELTLHVEQDKTSEPKPVPSGSHNGSTATKSVSGR